MDRIAAKIILLWGWKRIALAFLAGAATVLGLAPFDFFAVGFVTFPILVWLLDGATGDADMGSIRRLLTSFGVGWWFGFGYFCAGLWWTGNALLVDAENFMWALPVAIVVLPALLALFYGFAAMAARIFWVEGPSRVASLAVSIAVFEWLRTFLFSGFPWNPIGFVAAPVPFLMQITAISGILGLNALAVLVFAMPAVLISPVLRRTGLLSAVVVSMAIVAYGAYRIVLPVENSDRPYFALRIVQPAVDQQKKWDADERNRILSELVELSVARSDKVSPDAIIWPETAIPFVFTESPQLLAAIDEMLNAGQYLISGAVRKEGDDPSVARYYNSIVAIDGNGELAGTYDKVHLVPFGEYLPFSQMLSRMGLQRLVEGPGIFSAGKKIEFLPVTAKKNLNESQLSAVPLICYEIIFSAHSVVPSGADLIVNLTNDAWYGNTPGPYQHLRHVQFRAVETGYPIVRAANNGISAYIDPAGRIVRALALDEKGSFDVVANFVPLHSLYFTTKGWSGWATIGIVAVFALLAGIIAGRKMN